MSRLLEKALDTQSISATLSLPISVVQESLSSLIDSHLIVELKKPENAEAMFQPAKDINQLRVYEVIETLEKQGENQLPNMRSFTEFSKINTAFNKKIQASSDNCLLKDI